MPKSTMHSSVSLLRSQADVQGIALGIIGLVCMIVVGDAGTIGALVAGAAISTVVARRSQGQDWSQYWGKQPGWRELFATLSVSTVLGTLGTALPLLMLLVCGGLVYGSASLPALVGAWTMPLISGALSAVLAAGMLWPARLMLQATDPLASRRWLWWLAALPVVVCGVGPLALVALVAGISALWSLPLAAAVGNGLVVTTAALGLVVAVAQALSMRLRIANADWMASLKQQQATQKRLVETLRDHDLVLEEDAALPWLVDGHVHRASFRLVIVERKMPYRLRIEIEIPSLPDGFSVSVRGRRAGGKINDVILDGMFCVEGASPEQARALLSGLQAPLMALQGESVFFEIRDGQLVAEQYLNAAYKASFQDGRFSSIDDAIEVATQIAQRLRRPASVATPNRVRPQLKVR